MKILTENKVNEFLNSNLSVKTILELYQPTLIKSLDNYASNPNSVPPRVVQDSSTIEGSTHFFMPCIAPHEVGIKLITGGSANNAKGLGFQGTVVVEDEETGALKGLVNAKTLTAFRTALATSIAMVKAINPDKPNILPSIAVFGVGLQAYWHLKLALILYHGHIELIVIVNRSLMTADKFKGELTKEFPNINISTYLWIQDDINSDALTECSIIFGCTPSTDAIILDRFINKDPTYKTFIGLIGSYKPHMVELDLSFIKRNYKENERLPLIIVDSKHHCLDEAGELIQTGITSAQLVELSQLASVEEEQITTSGNITVLKVVGLSIMDISMAKLLLEIATGSIEVDDF